MAPQWQRKTERTIFRRFRLEDAPALRAYVSKPEVTQWDSPYPTDEEGARSVAEFFAGTPDFLAVCLSDTGQLIGHLHWGLREPSEAGIRNLGFIFDSAFWGRGLALESCREIIRIAFEEAGTQSFLTGTRVENERALRLLDRLGFTRNPQPHEGLEFVLFPPFKAG